MKNPKKVPSEAELMGFVPAPLGWVACYLHDLSEGKASVYACPIIGWATLEWDVELPTASTDDAATTASTRGYQDNEVEIHRAVRPFIMTLMGDVRDYLALEADFLCTVPPGQDAATAARMVLAMRGTKEDIFDVEMSLAN